MIHNKSICDNPVTVSIDWPTYTFTLLDQRHTRPEAIRSVLEKYICSYLSDLELDQYVPLNCCGNLEIELAGRAASVDVIEDLSYLQYEGEYLLFEGQPLVYGG